MKRVAGLALALASLWPASAFAAAPPCAPGTSARPTFKPGPGPLIATHPIDLRWDFGVAFIKDGSERVTAPAGVTVSRPNGEVSIRALRPGPTAIRLDWEQETMDEEGGFIGYCSATATTTLSIGAARRLRVLFTTPDAVRTLQGTVLGIGLYGPPSRSDLSDVQVRLRAVRGASRYPPAGARVYRRTFSLFDGLRSRRFELRTSARLYATTESFPDTDHAATVEVDGLRGLGDDSSRKAGGFDLEVRQSGRRLIRVRAKLYACNSHLGCRLRGLQIQR